jgi:outer membrane protein OmpA-like peptidoglycan-associated protein
VLYLVGNDPWWVILNAEDILSIFEIGTAFARRPDRGLSLRSLALSFATLLAFLFAAPSFADDALTSDGIVQALTPKHKTRGIGDADSGGLTSQQEEFVNSLRGRTRQILVEERTELTKVVKEAGLPALDLEIYFDFDSSAITPRAVPTLIKLGQALSSDQLKTSSFLISGHTDAKGAADYNQHLSEARAAAVKAFLVGNFQVDPLRLISVGYGKEDLKDPNDPEAAENRRVAIVNLVAPVGAPAFMPKLGQAGPSDDIARIKEDNDKALKLYQAGKYDEAASLIKHALVIQEKSLGPDHPDVATGLHNLAQLYVRQGRYAEAEPLHKRSLAIREKALGPDHPDVATSLNDLAALYDSQGRYADAEPLYKRALAIREKALGPDHPDVATSLNDLAALYDSQGPSEVAHLKLDADMVVLSACNTAAGDKPGAEALSGLARAFFYAGARSLIVSHWPVESDAAVKLMTSTFAAMGKDSKLTPSQALTKSMLAMIDDPNDPDAANPSFWAPFVVVGGARPAR